MSLKTCYYCKQNLPLDSFGVSRREKDGHAGACKGCMRKYRQKKYATDPVYRLRVKLSNAANPRRREQRTQAQRNHREEHKGVVSETGKIYHCLTRNGTRDALFWRTNSLCESCGKQIERGHRGYSIHHKDQDRSNNDLGNLMLVCSNCHLNKIHLRMKYPIAELGVIL